MVRRLTLRTSGQTHNARAYKYSTMGGFIKPTEDLLAVRGTLPLRAKSRATPKV
jgi:hypothetical protein